MPAAVAWQPDGVMLRLRLRSRYVVSCVVHFVSRVFTRAGSRRRARGTAFCRLGDLRTLRLRQRAEPHTREATTGLLTVNCVTAGSRYVSTNPPRRSVIHEGTMQESCSRDVVLSCRRDDANCGRSSLSLLPREQRRKETHTREPTTRVVVRHRATAPRIAPPAHDS